MTLGICSFRNSFFGDAASSNSSGPYTDARRASSQLSPSGCSGLSSERSTPQSQPHSASELPELTGNEAYEILKNMEGGAELGDTLMDLALATARKEIAIGELPRRSDLIRIAQIELCGNRKSVARIAREYGVPVRTLQNHIRPDGSVTEVGQRKIDQDYGNRG
jgi:hypothetical protein